MVPFLKQVAAAYYDRGLVESSCFIFPNRRSEVFFMKYLSDILAARTRAGENTVPLAVPATFTINDFIYRIYDIAPTGRIQLLLELYRIYSGMFGKAEPLDEFIFWGDIIIGDFNDVDKYLADASQLYTNIADLKSLQDSYSYLSVRQRKAIETFVSHFSDKDGRLTVDLGSDNPRVKEKFLQIWNILYPLYTAFRKSLSEKGMAYEGMVYRGVAERFLAEPADRILGGIFPGTEKFVFIGLNALNECEKAVMRKMKQASLAEFCWDYSGPMIMDRYNRSSFFMEENIREFPQSVATDGGGAPGIPEIKVISVPSSAGQVKLLPHIFREIADQSADGDLSGVGVLGKTEDDPGADCAVVLPDENLLMPVLNTIPPEIRDINVTMGYPMASSAFYLYMTLVMDVQMNLRKKGDRWYFYHKPVRTLFSDSIFRLAAGEEGRKRIDEVKSRAQLFIPAGDLDAGGVLSAVFRPVVTDRSAGGTEVQENFAAYLMDVIGKTVPALRKSGVDKVELEFAMEFSKTVASLRKTELPVKPQTYIRILRQILAPVSVPFKGEPLQGLQVMGPLETRALDFGNIVLMSANEGIFPRRTVSSSFIPPELRRGFGLPTYEYQDAVWAYYFYRMLSRAGHVWILYDSRTEGLKSGEESRYIKQLRYHFGVPLENYVVGAALSDSREAEAVPKTEEDIRRIREMDFSATSLQEYLSCPAKFYYHQVKRLGTDEEVSEVLDAGIFGNIFHEVMQALYLGEGAMQSDLPARQWSAQASPGERLKEVSAGYISSWLRRRTAIREKVRRLIMREMHTLEIAGRNLVVADVIVRYVMKTLSTDLELLKRAGRDSFRLVGLERSYNISFHGFRIKGVVDRIDTLSGDGIRIVDYKTGNVKDNDILISADNAEDIAGAVFGPDNGKRPKIVLQLYVYDKFLMQDPSMAGQTLYNCIYSATHLFSGLPELRPVEPVFVSSMDSHLEELFREMTDILVPFRLTGDLRICEYCDFKTICGR